MQLPTDLIGPTGTRIFYVILGLAIVAFGVWAAISSP